MFFSIFRQESWEVILIFFQDFFQDCFAKILKTILETVFKKILKNADLQFCQDWKVRDLLPTGVFNTFLAYARMMKMLGMLRTTLCVIDGWKVFQKLFFFQPGRGIWGVLPFLGSTPPPPPPRGGGGGGVFLEYFFTDLQNRQDFFWAQSGRLKTTSEEKMNCIRGLKNFLWGFEKKVWSRKTSKSRFFQDQNFCEKCFFGKTSWL